jgi:DNA-binding CsgD family transcriptional regulator
LDLLTADARLLVMGPVGSGRTTLLDELANHERPERRVWWCRGHRVGGPSGEPVLWDAPVEALLAEVGRQPTTVLVDDVDLLDGPALQRLVLLAERRHELGARVVAAHRPVAMTAELAALDHALIGRLGALHLGPVTADERTGGWAELVVADRAGSVPDLARSRMAVLTVDHQRVLQAICFGISPVSAGADDAVRAAVTVGLIHDGSTPVPVIAEAVRAATPAADRSHIAAQAVLAPPGELVTVAGHLLAAGDRSSDAAVVFERAADALRTTAPARSLDLYDAAVAAGRPADELRGARARAALAAGRVEEAVTFAGTAGAAWAHLGRPDLAADAYLSAHAPALAVLPLVAAGRLDAARAARATAPSSDADPLSLLADGALAWAAGDADGALALLTRSARVAELTGDVGEWPDTPHALAAMSAAHWLDGERAEALVTAALERSVGGATFEARHALLEAWVALRGGRFDEAMELLDGATVTAGRDALLAAAIRAAVAVRGDELDALPAIYQAAADAHSDSQPDPLAPGVSGELAHVAARIGADPRRILAPLDSLWRRLGEPPTIAVHLAWARLLVAVTTDDASAARGVADELAALAASTTIADDPTAGSPTALLAAAAQAFADVLGGVVDADVVRSLAAQMAERGLVFEASRLVGAAGIRSSEPAVARALLADLRRLRASQVRRGVRRRAVAELTERELEVARAVLDGRTHREIGAELFISAKTVEHHVARIRQKLGAGSKAELLAAIREELARASGA